MEEPDLIDVARFLQRYEQFQQDHSLQTPDAFIEAFNRFKLTYAVLETAVRDRVRVEAPAFNIFRLLGVAYREATTHSAFLATLLDPEGKHGQRHLFLLTFLNYCRMTLPGFPDVAGAETADWLIQTERRTGNGNLDIVLESSEAGFLCVIENKVFAGEQPQQLQRYGRWLVEQREFPLRALVFLTPDGRPATTGGGFDCFHLSYNSNIADWLGSVLDEIEAPTVRETVRQYIQLAKGL